MAIWNKFSTTAQKKKNIKQLQWRISSSVRQKYAFYDTFRLISSSQWPNSLWFLTLTLKRWNVFRNWIRNNWILLKTVSFKMWCMMLRESNSQNSCRSQPMAWLIWLLLFAIIFKVSLWSYKTAKIKKSLNLKLHFWIIKT